MQGRPRRLLTPGSRLDFRFPTSDFPEPPQAKPARDEKKDEVEHERDALPTSTPPPAGALSSWGRGRGNVFLVDVRGSSVAWSVHESALDGTARELDRAAIRIVSRLEKDIARTKPKP